MVAHKKRGILTLDFNKRVNSTRTYYTANGTQRYVPAWMGRGFGEEWIRVYGRLSPFAVHLKLP